MFVFRFYEYAWFFALYNAIGRRVGNVLNVYSAVARLHDIVAAGYPYSGF
jgi:hypothetical protein